MLSFTPTDETWDAFVLSQPRAHVLQLAGWGALKSAYGWQMERIALAAPDGQIAAGAQVLLRPLPARLGLLAYLPFGPFVTDNTLWEPLWQALRERLRARRAAFLKWEPGFYLDEPAPDPTQWGFRPAPQDIQPPRTIMLDIHADDETILTRMNQGTRRKIRKSLKENIRYYEGQRSDMAAFNSLMQTTGERNAFGVHEPAYYDLMYELFVPQHAALILAEHEGDVLAGLMVFQSGTVAQYICGGSSDHKRNLMASYGVQWQAIQWARARGCTHYDLWGVPDEDEDTLEAQFQQRSDGLWGVYGFKRGWGGQVLRAAGSWDLVYNPVVYAAYRLALYLLAR